MSRHAGAGLSANRLIVKHRARQSGGRIRYLPDEILDPFGLSAVQFDDPDFEIPYVIAGRLLARCATATQCPHFGLLAGICAHPSSLGVPGFLLTNSPDVGTALRSWDILNRAQPRCVRPQPAVWRTHGTMRYLSTSQAAIQTEYPICSRNPLSGSPPWPC